jgi:hypothetical protein
MEQNDTKRTGEAALPVVLQGRARPTSCTPGMLGHVRYAYDLNAGLCHRMVVLDRTPGDANGADQHAFVIDDR